MALIEKDGIYDGETRDVYHKAFSIIGIMPDGGAEVRTKIFPSLESRENSIENGKFDKVNFKFTKERHDKIMTLVYEQMKELEVPGPPIIHPSETDENGALTKKAWSEETFDYPYADMIDC